MRKLSGWMRRSSERLAGAGKEHDEKERGPRCLDHNKGD
jgi:hypothetical protein